MSKKPFECARITPNDDGTFNVGIEPLRKKDKKGALVYGDEHRMSAANLQEAIKKLSGYGTSEDEDVANFMNPERGKQETMEEGEGEEET